MKLQTSIQPRRDGTVKVTGQDSQTYVFVTGSDGELTCDVADEPTVAHLLATENFWPADPADFAAAEKLVIDQSDDDEEADDEQDDEEVQGGLPVEAETPPAAAPGRKTRKAK